MSFKNVLVFIMRRSRSLLSQLVLENALETGEHLNRQLNVEIKAVVDQQLNLVIDDLFPQSSHFNNF